MNIFSHITTAPHTTENSSVLHWIQTDGIRSLIIAVALSTIVFTAKRLTSGRVRTK